MLAAARKHGRVVQIGTQRRSTPHLVEAREQIVKQGKLGKVGVVEICCYYPSGPRAVYPETAVPESLDWEFWSGPAPLRAYSPRIHPIGWRGFMEYGNGTLGDMGVHMFDMTRWMLDLGWPKRISSSGGILVQKGGSSNITDTQTATFDYGDLQVIWTHRSYGAPVDEKYPWAATFFGEKGTLKASVYSYDYAPFGSGPKVHKDVTYELDKYPEDRTEPNLEKHCAPAIRHHMLNLLECMGTRGRPVADIEEGHISSASCILGNVAMQLGRTLAWDEKAGRVAGDEEANALLRRPYRAPWVHPEPERV
jgi:predicted dehydrogenase